MSIAERLSQSASIAWSHGVPGTPTEVAVALLELDSENARLPEEMVGEPQEALLRYFFEHYDLVELGESMAAHGYFAQEPLLCVAGSGGKFIVVEGNRRLATLVLLTNETQRKAIAPGWDDLAQRAAKQRLDPQSVLVYADRAELRPYLGFRHVSGLMGWDPDARARWVHRQIRSGHSFRDLAREIGSEPAAIRRQFVAWSCLLQARKEGYEVDAAINSFGVYFRAIQSKPIRDFLGLEAWTTGDEGVIAPLPHGAESLNELFGYLFGKDRVITDSRKIEPLGRALADEVSREMLRQTRDLDVALLQLSPEPVRVRAAIRTAATYVARANGEAFRFKGDPDMIAETDRLSQAVQALRSALAAD